MRCCTNRRCHKKLSVVIVYRTSAAGLTVRDRRQHARPPMDHTIRVCRCFGPKHDTSGCLRGCMGTTTTTTATAKFPRATDYCSRRSDLATTKARTYKNNVPVRRVWVTQIIYLWKRVCLTRTVQDSMHILVQTSGWHRAAQPYCNHMHLFHT